MSDYVLTESERYLRDVGIKIAMAEYHWERLSTLSHQTGDCPPLHIRAEYEACIHCLHHCLDILAHAIRCHYPDLQEKLPPHKVTFWNVTQSLDEQSQLRLMLDKLSEETKELQDYANHTKHYESVPVNKVVVVGSDYPKNVYSLGILVDSFSHKGRSYDAAFGLSWVQQLMETMRMAQSNVRGYLTEHPDIP